MLVPIILSGFLAKRFGKRFDLDVRSPREAVRALSFQLKGFEKALMDHQAGFRVWADREPLDKANLDRCTGARPIRIVPVVAGSKSPGEMILMGAALFFGAQEITDLMYLNGIGTTSFDVDLSLGLHGIGSALMIAGVARLLFKPPTPPTTGQSYLFNGPVNTSAQGNCVPVCYGRMRAGSQLISAGVIPNQMSSPIPVTIPGSGSGWNPTLTNAVG